MTIHQKPDKSVVYHIETLCPVRDCSGASSGHAFGNVTGVYKDGERHVNLLMDPMTVFVHPLGNKPSNTQIPTNKMDAAKVEFDERGMCFVDTGLQATVGNNLPYFILFSRGRCYLHALSTSNSSDVSFTVSYVDVSIKSDSAPTAPKWAYPISPVVVTSKAKFQRHRTNIFDSLLVRHGRYTAIVATLSMIIMLRCLRRCTRRRDEPPIYPHNPIPNLSLVPYVMCIGSGYSTVRTLVGMIGCIAWYVQTRLQST
jgi:hypothetical protein